MTKSNLQQIKKDIDYFLEWTLCILLDMKKEKRFVSLFRQVLQKSWPDLKERIHEIQAIVCCDTPFCEWKDFNFCRFTVPRGKKFVLGFPSNILCTSDEQVRSIIAHELAHFKIRHWSSFETGEKAFEEKEKAADALAAKWGFRDSLE